MGGTPTFWGRKPQNLVLCAPKASGFGEICFFRGKSGDFKWVDKTFWMTGVRPPNGVSTQKLTFFADKPYTPYFLSFCGDRGCSHFSGKGGRIIPKSDLLRKMIRACGVLLENPIPILPRKFSLYRKVSATIVVYTGNTTRPCPV